jgi:hypothetical protein
MRIGKTPKKLASICCPQRREIKADTLKATEADWRRGPGTREKVRSKRINLLGNTHAQKINVSQRPVYLSLSHLAKTLFLPIIVYTLSSTKLEIRAKEFLPGTEGVGRRERGRSGW